MKLILIFILMLITNCGESSLVEPTNGNDQTIIISSLSFFPTNLSISPGDTIFIINQDSQPHHIQSQSADDQFDDTGAFDSFIIGPNSEGIIIVPESVTTGTTLFFYDDILQDGMLTPNGSIVVQ